MGTYKTLLDEAGIATDYQTALVRGIPQNPMFDVAAFEQVIDQFQTKDGDAFVTTYVKAGTTWVQQIVHCLLHQGANAGQYGESVPWLEACGSSPEVIGPREAPNWTMAAINAALAPRYFKSHATVRDLPRGHANIKVIYVARNPKDTVVSLFHHARNKPEFQFTGDFATFLQIFLADLAENASWFAHVLDWHDECQRNADTHLFLKYEDIYDDTAQYIERIAQFLDIPTTGKTLADTLRNTSLQAMKKHASIGMNHIRKGGYGGWRTLFTADMNAQFDAIYKAKMAGSGLQFNFGVNPDGADVIF